MKRIFFFLVLCILVPVVARGAQESVWVTAVPPKDTATLVKGDDVLIYSALHNETKDPITYTLLITQGEKSIGTKTTTVPGFTQQAVSVPWKYPDAKTDITARITKAVDKHKKELKALETVIGTTTIGGMVEPSLPELGAVKGFFGKYFGGVESWRIKQANYFAHLKVQSKQEAGETTINDVTNYLQPEPPTAPGQPSSQKSIDDGHSKAYLTLLLATAGESFFGHRAFFYIASCSVLLLILKTIFRRFF